MTTIEDIQCRFEFICDKQWDDLEQTSQNQSDTVVIAQGTSIYVIPKSSLNVARLDGIAFAINLA